MCCHRVHTPGKLIFMVWTSALILEELQPLSEGWKCGSDEGGGELYMLPSASWRKLLFILCNKAAIGPLYILVSWTK